MHDGHYATVLELLRDGKHGLVNGEEKKLTDQEMNDLVEFLMSL